MTSDYTGLYSTSSLPAVYRRFQTSISCHNCIYGCNKRFSTLEERQNHKQLCDFELNQDIQCGNCLIQMQRSKLKRHNCIQELRTTLDELKDIITGLELKVNQQMIDLNNAKQILYSSAPIPTQQPDYDNHCKSELESPKPEVFESEPQIDIKERQVSESSDTPVLSRASSYRRFNREISKDVEFGMYGSLKYRYLSRLSRDFNHEFSEDLPPVDYDLDIEKKNKQLLIDVCKDSDDVQQKPPLVRLRAWTDRD